MELRARARLQRARTSTTMCARLQPMMPTPSWTGPVSMNLRMLIGIGYTIVAVDLTVDGPTTATVYAFDRIGHGISRLAEDDRAGPAARFGCVLFDLRGSSASNS